MVIKLSRRTLDNCEEVHPVLLAVAMLAMKERDFTVICGRRNEEAQTQAFEQGRTKVQYPNSAHNQYPACAIDVIPYPFNGWDDVEAFREVAVAFDNAAKVMGVQIRWGGDFARDGYSGPTDKDGWDKPHFELHPWREWAK